MLTGEIQLLFTQALFGEVLKYNLLGKDGAHLLQGATFSKGCCAMFNKEQNVEECDATGLHISNAAWPI